MKIMSFKEYLKENNTNSTSEVVKILTEIEKSQHGVYRKFMTSEEVKICNELVKNGMLLKSKPDEKNATIAFFITDKGSKWLETQN